MKRERIGFDCGFPFPAIAECVNCDLILAYTESHDWLSLTNEPPYARRPGEQATALGWCPTCGAWQRTAHTLSEREAEKEPQGVLF